MSLQFNFNRKEISSEEIASKMNFREVLSNYKVLTKPFYKTAWFASTVGITLVGITALVVMNTTSVSDKNTNPKSSQTIDKTSTYKEDSPCINPPSKEADIPFSVYQINNDTGGQITHPSGSQIDIPAGVFVQNGEKVKGNVEIRYREFRDQADFILSGIPMTYDSAGTQYHFESAGMIEIRAFQNNEAVELNGEIEVAMKSDYPGTKYNLYALNESEKNWECIGKDKLSEVMESNPESEGNENTRNFTEVKKNIKETENKLVAVKKEITQLKSSVPEEPKKRNLKNYSFTIDFLMDEFPELIPFAKQKFEVDAMTKGFDPKFYNTEWEDIVIKKDPRTGKLKMMLTRNYRTSSFEIYPVFEGKDYESKKEDFDDAMLVYSMKLKNKLEEESALNRQMEELRKSTHQKSTELSKEWQKKQYEEEKSALAINEQGEDLEKRYGTNLNQGTENVRMVDGMLRVNGFQNTRSFSIGNLGVCNVDFAVEIPKKKKGKKHHLNFFSKVGEALILTKIFVIEKARNLMFTYVDDDIYNIHINEKDKNVIVGICSDGRIAVFNETDFTFLNLEENELELKFQVFDKFESANEFREIIQS